MDHRIQCTLCSSDAVFYCDFKSELFYQCSACNAVLRPPNQLPSQEKEKEIYLLHENDVNDLAYQKFVSPIVDAVMGMESKGSTGLDYGSGTGPVITKLLRENGYNMQLYDPFFQNDEEVLNKKYDFIVCCEVMEHFFNPKQEFQKLSKMLINSGNLYCMTSLLNNKVPFKDWGYKNDPTHVIIYDSKSIAWIAEELDFTDYEIEGRLIIFEK